MTNRDLVRLSKFLSLILRHTPGTVGLKLDEHGWADVDELIKLVNRSGRHLTRSVLDRVVAENDKKRFEYSTNAAKIRASQGHSLDIDLGLKPIEPPELLYHGTASKFLFLIQINGLRAGRRQHVHLSTDLPTALKVGARHGRPIALVVRSREMHAAGYKFFLSVNGAWLTARVPVQYLQVVDSFNSLLADVEIRCYYGYEAALDLGSADREKICTLARRCGPSEIGIILQEMDHLRDDDVPGWDGDGRDDYYRLRKRLLRDSCAGWRGRNRTAAKSTRQ